MHDVGVMRGDARVRVAVGLGSRVAGIDRVVEIGLGVTGVDRVTSSTTTSRTAPATPRTRGCPGSARSAPRLGVVRGVAWQGRCGDLEQGTLIVSAAVLVAVVLAAVFAAVHRRARSTPGASIEVEHKVPTLDPVAPGLAVV